MILVTVCEVQNVEVVQERHKKGRKVREVAVEERL